MFAGTLVVNMHTLTCHAMLELEQERVQGKASRYLSTATGVRFVAERTLAFVNTLETEKPMHGMNRALSKSVDRIVATSSRHRRVSEVFICDGYSSISVAKTPPKRFHVNASLFTLSSLLCSALQKQLNSITCAMQAARGEKHSARVNGSIHKT